MRCSIEQGKTGRVREKPHLTRYVITLDCVMMLLAIMPQIERTCQLLMRFCRIAVTLQLDRVVLSGYNASHVS